MSDRVKAIPLYMSKSDVLTLYKNLQLIVKNPNFTDDTTVILGQLPMSLDLYLCIRYDGLEDESIINF